MKHLSFFGLLMVALLSSCTSKQAAVGKMEAENTAKTVVCPEDGLCSTQLYKNKKLEILTDGIGALYYEMKDHPGSSVVIYQYNRKVEKGLQDGHYKEEIIFEIQDLETQVSLVDLDLQKTKMLFGRICFCKGYTGYYKVVSGRLELDQQQGNVHFDLNFKVTQVPQIITTIQSSVK